MKALLQNGILLVVSIAVALALSELIVRVFEIGPEIQAVSFENHMISENPVIGYELIPNSRDGDTTINGDGMRDRDYPLKKPEDTFRIAVVGDSITFGYNVESHETYAKQLETLLNSNLESEQRYEVMNFGISGYNVIQIAENLRTKALEYDPDLILYGYCLNDPQEYSHEMETLLNRLQADERDYLNVRRYSRGLLARSKLFLLARYMLSSSPQNRQADDHREGAGTDPQFAALREGNHVSYFRGLHRYDDGSQRLKRGLKIISDVTEVPLIAVIFPVFDNLENYPLTSVHEFVKQAFLDHGHQVIDLSGPYARGLENTSHRLNYEPLHPTPAGHLFAAGVIAKYLVETRGLPGVPEEDATRILTDKQLMRAGFSEILGSAPG